MKSMIVMMLLAAVSVAGDVRLGPAQPISEDRIGIAGESRSHWMISGGNDTFLLVWRDDRHEWPKFGSGGYLAMRLSADGTPLDEFPIFLPVWVHAVARGDGEWFLIGYSTVVRFSDEGKITAVKTLPRFGVPQALSIAGAAWTGQALVIAASTYTLPSSGSGYTGAASVMTLDAELNHVATNVLSHQASFTLGIAGDGVSSAMVVYQTRPDGDAIRAAVFDVNGQLRKDSIFHAIADFNPSGDAIAIGPGRYAIAVGTTGETEPRMEVMTLDTDLRKSYVGSLSGHRGHTMFWDGSEVTMYTLTPAGREQDLALTRFTPGEQQELATARLSSWDRNSGFDIGRAGDRGIITTYEWLDQTYVPRFRMFGDPNELKTKTPFRTLSLNRGAFAQGAAAGASAATQSVVTWLERESRPTFAVYATRVDRNGKVLDPQSLPLGDTPCGDFAPVIASNGTDFLAAWASGTTRLAAIRPDGIVETRVMNLRTTTGCVDMRLASNGEDFLLVWPDKKTSAATIWNLMGARLSADGTAIDTKPILIASGITTTTGTNLQLAIASDGRDYLVAWEKSALRVTNDGAVLNRIQPIPLGNSVVRAWWNGRTYVVQTGNALLRIGTDGTGGAPLGLIPLPENAWFTPNALCDVGGCSYAMLSWPEDRSYFGTALGRLTDDGTNFTMTQTPVATFIYPQELDGSGPHAPAFLLNAGRLLFVNRIARSEAPYAGVQRLLITPVGVPRTRAVSH